MRLQRGRSIWTGVYAVASATLVVAPLFYLLDGNVRLDVVAGLLLFLLDHAFENRLPAVLVFLEQQEVLFADLKQLSDLTDAVQPADVLLLNVEGVFFAEPRAWSVNFKPVNERHVLDFGELLSQNVFTGARSLQHFYQRVLVSPH